MQPNLYDIIGIKRGATVEEINAAYRKRAFELHPDRNKNQEAEDQIKLLNVARATLVDQVKRLQYDASLVQSVARPGTQHAWFCPACSDVRVFIAQAAWRCNVCGLTGKLFRSAAWLEAPAEPLRGAFAPDAARRIR